MQMVRQYHHRDDIERMGLADFSDNVPEQINFFNEQIAFSISKIDGEKIGGAGDLRSSISHELIALNVGLVKC
jgi:hypothetical protein